MAPKNNNQGPKKAHPKKGTYYSLSYYLVAKKITKRATKGKSTKPKVARKQPRTTETVGASKVIVPNASK